MDNAKHAQFRIMPRYKVKAEGDVVSLLECAVILHIRYKYRIHPTKCLRSLENYKKAQPLDLFDVKIVSCKKDA